MSTSADAAEARELVARSDDLCRWGYPVRALPLLLRAVQLAPDNEAARQAVQTTRERIRQLDAEVTQCEQTLAANPTDPKALQTMFKALMRLDRDADAEAALARALELDAAGWEALFDVGILLNNNSRFEDALKVFDRLCAVEPEWALGWTFKGMVLCNMWRADEALSVLEHALALDSKDIGAWTSKVEALRRLGREAEAHEAHKHERAARIASGVPEWMPRDHPDEALDDDEWSDP